MVGRYFVYLPDLKIARVIHDYCSRVSVMCCSDPQNFLDPRTDSPSVAYEKLRTENDADRIPSVSLTRIFFV